LASGVKALVSIAAAGEQCAAIDRRRPTPLLEASVPNPRIYLGRTYFP
jgi:hypothetical protein